MTRKDVIASVPFFAVAAFFTYEGYAILTKRVPTISRIMAYDIDTHPPVEGMAASFMLGGIAFMLIDHFSNKLRWWKP